MFSKAQTKKNEKKREDKKMVKNILSVMLILILLLTFGFGYTPDDDITSEDNFSINVEKMDSWSSTLLNTFNNYVSDIKNNTLLKYMQVMDYLSNVGEGLNNIEINKVTDIFNKSNIFNFVKSLGTLLLAPFYILYSFSMLMFNITYLTAKLTVNLVITCIDIGRILS